jgi:hypothetical protein
MSVIRSIVLLASVALAVAFALFVGHGIAVEHKAKPIMWGVIFLVAAVALAYLQIRADGKRVR